MSESNTTVSEESGEQTTGKSTYKFPDVLHEDNHTIVVNKRSGDIVQGDKTGDEPLSEQIKRFLKKKYNKQGNIFCGVVHRLDRPTTGALVFAKTSKAIGRLNTQFRDKETKKIYWAIVENKPKNDTGRLEHFLKKNEKQNKSYASDTETKGSKHAVLDYKLIASSDKYFLLEIVLETGRHHQIRCQLGTIDCIIKGDLKYGAKRSNKDGSICLHARELTYTHPTTQELVHITAPVPNDPLWKYFEEAVK
ncbi:MAG: 23S rRNA pseudouridine1911/1915/1917 synthase [Flavobacteriaceae bacterium]|jgi:23S rRNA pseudouridine1911/1915/1917 synthase